MHDRTAVEALVSLLTHQRGLRDGKDITEHGGMERDDTFVESEGSGLGNDDNVPILEPASGKPAFAKYQ